MNAVRTSAAGAALALALLSSPAEAQVGRGDLVNPNRAGAEELASLPHVGAEVAEKIVAGRPWLGMPALDEALREEGRTPEQLAELYARLFIPLNLNTATPAEIQLIPGVGPRVTREFEEYRPYVALAEWRREIGKYVDDAELARMEAYVFVPIDLNTASDGDILSIPGVGARMLREFKEYRPYAGMAEFRREIGKYVDDGEVERLARYVEIR